MRRRGLVLALGLSGAVIVAGTVPVAAAAPPASFDLAAVAVVARVSSTQQPAASVITADLVDVTAGFASSSLRDGGSAESLASSLYPGDLVAGGPALLCQELFPCPVTPPGYPLVADAAYPTQPEAAVTVGPITARATASALRTEARADGAALPTAVPVGWAAAVSATRAWVTDGTAHLVARSVLHDLTIGPVRIAVLDSTDVVDLPVGRQPTARPAVTVTGVTVAGHQATLDQSGLHVEGQSASVTQQELAQQGLSIRLLGERSNQGVGAARVFAGALELVFTRPVSGAPTLPGLPGLDRVYVTSVLLGGTGIVGAAGGSALLDLPPELGLSDPTAAVPAPHLPPRTQVGPTTSVTGSSPSIALPQLRTRAVAVVDRFDLSALALALALLPTSLLLLWRAKAGLRARRP
ncbi:MAG: hypothetical protein JWM40_2393 [Frankiales bacterium]|nr:hypothetical protein [Frankiales bacterium]